MADEKELLETKLIGMTKDDAGKLIKDSGLTSRVVAENGEHFMVSMDLVDDRFNLEIVDGKVVEAYRG